MFYTLITWLPDILHTNGYNSNNAGWMVFLMQFALIPATFIVPVIAEKLKNQVGLSIATATLFIVGFFWAAARKPCAGPFMGNYAWNCWRKCF